MALPRIIFILGPSGVGKSEFSHSLANALKYDHVETDLYRQDGIEVEQLREEWNIFSNVNDAAPLAKTLNQRIKLRECSGLIISFSSLTWLSDEQLLELCKNEIAPIILFAEREECLRSFLERERKTGRQLSANHWERHNHCFDRFGRSGIEKFRIRTFESGVRKNDKTLIEEVKTSIAKMPISGNTL
jgi:shikimate kinase